MTPAPTIWFNAGDGGYWRRLWHIAMQAAFHPNIVSRHVARKIVKRRLARLLRMKAP